MLLLLLLFAAGLAAGFVDAIAGGGGLITVPALLWAGLPVQWALGTNKMQAACGTLLAVSRFAQAGWIAWRDVRLAMVVTFVFAALGAWSVTLLSKDLLKHGAPLVRVGFLIVVFALSLKLLWDQF
jgi:uncharacterized membrane protein YfcA